MKSLKKSLGKKGLGVARRKSVDVSTGDLVALRPLSETDSLPLLASPNVPGVDLIDWVSRHRELIGERLREHGGILFRGFSLASIDHFEQVVKALSGELLRYTYRSTPRSEVEGRIYTSTEYPPDQTIPMHNEMSYSRHWPRKIWFYCVQSAESGGETPIADSRAVYRRIDPEVRRRFLERGVMYIRNYGGGLDLPWQNVFGTEDRREVEAFCKDSGIEYEWRSGDRLRTRQICQGVCNHPDTDEPLWFNQAHLFHVSSLLPELRESLLEDLGEDELPRHARFGDGSSIEEDDLAEIRAAYEQEMVIFPWQDGDLVLLDNMLTAHGRRPFSGKRRVLVGMAEQGP